MIEAAPWYVQAMMYSMIVMTIATVGVLVAGLLLMFNDAWKKHKRGGNDEPEGGGWGGGGGWTDKPGPTPPGGGGGGGDDDLHEQFHAIADAIGRVIHEEKKKEKVLR
jgi:hypothetical protein